MGGAVHGTYRVEGRRDETHTIKTERSPRSAAKAKEKTAGVDRRPWLFISALPCGVGFQGWLGVLQI